MYFDHPLRALAVNLALAPGVALIFVQGTDNKSSHEPEVLPWGMKIEGARWTLWTIWT